MLRAVAEDPDANPDDAGPGGWRADQAAEQPLGRRERNRLARHRAYLRTAMAIVSDEGLDALTMQRIADELDCAVGTIYTYFPSKGALVAEVQREAIERLTASYLTIRAETDRLLEVEGVSAGVGALTRLVGMGRFWIATPAAFPQEAQLMQLLMSEQREVMATSDTGRVLPAALRHLDLARALLADAVDRRALDPADSDWERVVTWLAAINGVVQVSRLATHDAELFDGERLAARLNLDLLRSWGADPRALTRADAQIDRLSSRVALAPPVPDPLAESP